MVWRYIEFTDVELKLATLMVPLFFPMVPGRRNTYYNETYTRKITARQRRHFLQRCWLGAKKQRRIERICGKTVERAYAIFYPLCEINGGPIAAYVNDSEILLVDRLEKEMLGSLLEGEQWNVELLQEVLLNWRTHIPDQEEYKMVSWLGIWSPGRIVDWQEQVDNRVARIKRWLEFGLSQERCLVL